MIVSGNSVVRNNPTILKQTVAIGRYRFHRVFFKVPTTLTVSLPYIGATSGELDETGFIQVIPESTTDPVIAYTTDTTAITSTVSVFSNPNEVRWIFSVSAGYSWIIIDYSVHPNAADLTVVTYPFRINWFTIPYQCPFNVEYPDVTGIFKGCTFAPDVSRLPCVVYN